MKRSQILLCAAGLLAFARPAAADVDFRPNETVDAWTDADVAALAGQHQLPNEVFQLPKRQIAHLLWHLWRKRGAHGWALNLDSCRLLTRRCR